METKNVPFSSENLHQRLSAKVVLLGLLFALGLLALFSSLQYGWPVSFSSASKPAAAPVEQPSVTVEPVHHTSAPAVALAPPTQAEIPGGEMQTPEEAAAVAAPAPAPAPAPTPVAKARTPTDLDASAIRASKNLLQDDYLKSPATVQWVSAKVLDRQDDKFLVKLVFDAQDGFGAMSRDCVLVALEADDPAGRTFHTNSRYDAVHKCCWTQFTPPNTMKELNKWDMSKVAPAAQVLGCDERPDR